MTWTRSKFSAIALTLLAPWTNALLDRPAMEGTMICGEINNECA
jgi:hypothetical protein